eukprot:5169057-Prymnesium_polylepis.2
MERDRLTWRGIAADGDGWNPGGIERERGRTYSERDRNPRPPAALGDASSPRRVSLPMPHMAPGRSCGVRSLVWQERAQKKGGDRSKSPGKKGRGRVRVKRRSKSPKNVQTGTRQPR